MVELKDDRLPGGAPQFQPRSASCSLKSRPTNLLLATPK
jgi:hypothetical protein